MDHEAPRHQARRNRQLVLITLLIAGLLVTVPVDANAQQEKGVRAGVSSSPGQFYFGGHVERGPLVDRLWFRPNAELGLRNDQVLIAFNLEFAYRIPIQGKPWATYLGAGPALNVRGWTEGGGDRQTDLLGGFNLLVGIAHKDGLFTELKIGVMDNPDLKFTVGYSFR